MKIKEKYRFLCKEKLKKTNFKAKCSHYPLLDNLLKIIKKLKAKKILIFIPLNYEPNVYKLKRKLSKFEIFTTFIQQLNLKMIKLRLPLISKKFKIKEPKHKKECKRKIDLAILPVIGVDGNLARIGHGFGYYDKFFSENPRPNNIIFVSNINLFNKKIICEEHDISCDFYLTPRKNYLKKGKNDRNFNRIRSWGSGSWNRVSVRKKDK